MLRKLLFFAIGILVPASPGVAADAYDPKLITQLNELLEKSVRSAVHGNSGRDMRLPGEMALATILLDAKTIVAFEKDGAACVRYELLPPLQGALEACPGSEQATGSAALAPELGDYGEETKLVREYLKNAKLDVDLEGAFVAPKLSTDFGWYYAFIAKDPTGKRIGIRAFPIGRIEHFAVPPPSAGEAETTLFELF